MALACPWPAGAPRRGRAVGASGPACRWRRRSCENLFVQDGQNAPDRGFDPIGPVVGLVVDLVEGLGEEMQAQEAGPAAYVLDPCRAAARGLLVGAEKGRF